MVMEVFHNFKEYEAKLRGSRIGLALYKIVGKEIADGIWEEFETLVRGTAQYTGSTAASWNIAAAQVPVGGRTRIRELGPDETPLYAGHSAAVNLALSAEENNLDNLYQKTKTFGINVWNEAPGITEGVADTGPFRPENVAAGAEVENFAKFKQRVQSRVFDPFKGVVDVADMERIAASL